MGKFHNSRTAAGGRTNNEGSNPQSNLHLNTGQDTRRERTNEKSSVERNSGSLSRPRLEDFTAGLKEVLAELENKLGELPSKDASDKRLCSLTQVLRQGVQIKIDPSTIQDNIKQLCGLLDSAISKRSDDPVSEELRVINKTLTELCQQMQEQVTSQGDATMPAPYVTVNLPPRDVQSLQVLIRQDKDDTAHAVTPEEEAAEIKRKAREQHEGKTLDKLREELESTNELKDKLKNEVTKAELSAEIKRLELLEAEFKAREEHYENVRDILKKLDDAQKRLNKERVAPEHPKRNSSITREQNRIKKYREELKELKDNTPPAQLVSLERLARMLAKMSTEAIEYYTERVNKMQASLSNIEEATDREMLQDYVSRAGKGKLPTSDIYRAIANNRAVVASRYGAPTESKKSQTAVDTPNELETQMLGEIKEPAGKEETATDVENEWRTKMLDEIAEQQQLGITPADFIRRKFPKKGGRAAYGKIAGHVAHGEHAGAQQAHQGRAGMSPR